MYSIDCDVSKMERSTARLANGRKLNERKQNSFTLFSFIFRNILGKCALEPLRILQKSQMLDDKN